MEELMVFFAIVMLIALLRNNKFVRPFAKELLYVFTFITSLIVGSIAGFTIGYFKFARIGNIDVPLEFIFSEESFWGKVFLGPIRDRIVLYTIWGGIFGAVLSVLSIWLVAAIKRRRIERNNVSV